MGGMWYGDGDVETVGNFVECEEGDWGILECEEMGGMDFFLGAIQLQFIARGLFPLIPSQFHSTFLNRRGIGKWLQVPEPRVLHELGRLDTSQLVAKILPIDLL